MTRPLLLTKGEEALIRTLRTLPSGELFALARGDQVAEVVRKLGRELFEAWATAPGNSVAVKHLAQPLSAPPATQAELDALMLHFSELLTERLGRRFGFALCVGDLTQRLHVATGSNLREDLRVQLLRHAIVSFESGTDTPSPLTPNVHPKPGKPL